ncbi:54S ribosomal protein L17 mitochondrial, partial [Nowakowskiella sp. JEL0078]
MQDFKIQAIEIKALKLAERTTEDDKIGDTTSLKRKLDENLYLVGKSQLGWRFLETDLIDKELLHESAKRFLSDILGKGSEFWVVGRVPVGHLSSKDDKR